MAPKTCDGKGLLIACRERGREPPAPRRRDQRAQRLPGPRWRHRHEHACDGPRGARRGREGWARGRPRTRRAGGQLRRADGRARQLRRDHAARSLPDSPWPCRQEAVQRPRPRQRPRRGHQDRLQGRGEAGRGDDPHGHPRVVGRRGRGRGAGQRCREGPGRARGGGRAVRRAHPDAAAHPARGARRRFGRPGPVPPVPGGARRGAWPRRHRRWRGAQGPHRHGGRGRRAPRSATGSHALEDEAFGYETVFVLQPTPGTSLEVATIQRHLEAMGESVLVAGGPRS